MLIKVGKTYRRCGDNAKMKVTQIKNNMVSYSIQGGGYNRSAGIGMGLTRMDVFITKCARTKESAEKRNSKIRKTNNS